MLGINKLDWLYLEIGVCTGRIGQVEVNIFNQPTVGWENSNSAVESPTHQSINPADRLKILTISTWLVEQVGQADKCN